LTKLSSQEGGAFFLRNGVVAPLSVKVANIHFSQTHYRKQSSTVISNCL